MGELNFAGSFLVQNWELREIYEFYYGNNPSRRAVKHRVGQEGGHFFEIEMSQLFFVI